MQNKKVQSGKVSGSTSFQSLLLAINILTIYELYSYAIIYYN